MPKGISVVINTFNEERDIERAIRSVKWAQEVIVCDMHSTDKTVELTKKLGAKIFYHKKEDFVEPARNFAISKAEYDWVLILDPDEAIAENLKVKLTKISDKMNKIDYVKVPRKNIIFGKWMQASKWWPDLNIRFFRKGKVSWTNKIHQPPKALGQGLDLEAQEDYAIIHHHYESITQFLERMIRYTKIQAEELKKEGYLFDYKDLIKKPLSEFLSRFFANRGFEDGLHGLALSLLQSFSFLIVYLRLWEMEKFKQQSIDLKEFKEVNNQAGEELKYWFNYSSLSKNPFKSFLQKVKGKI